MRLFLQIISSLFHPLFIPFIGTSAYFFVTPKYSPLEILSGNILPIFILTVIIPILFFLILKNLGLVNSVFMLDLKERKYPFYISIILLFLVVLKVIPNNFIIELHYYFLGLIIATTASLILLFLNFKSSMHLMGMGSLLMFVISLSVHFEINISMAISTIILAIGIVATSRLYLKAHNRTEVLIGLIIGLASQLLTIRFWL